MLQCADESAAGRASADMIVDRNALHCVERARGKRQKHNVGGVKLGRHDIDGCNNLESKQVKFL
jgi:hypothetical protein